MGVGRLGIDSGTTSKCFVFWDCFRNFQKNKKLFRSIWHFGPDPDQVQNSWTLVPLSPSSLLSSTSIRWSLCIDYTQPSGVWLVTIIISVIIVIIRIIIRMMNHQQRKLDGRRGWGIDYTSRWLVWSLQAEFRCRNTFPISDASSQPAFELTPSNMMSNILYHSYIKPFSKGNLNTTTNQPSNQKLKSEHRPNWIKQKWSAQISQQEMPQIVKCHCHKLCAPTAPSCLSPRWSQSLPKCAFQIIWRKRAHINCTLVGCVLKFRQEQCNVDFIPFCNV